MNKAKNLALLAFLLPGTLHSGDGKALDGIMAIHAAVPMGPLSTDTNDQLGFGFSLAIQQPLTPRTAVRGSFSWTGFRVNDRNLWARAIASIFDQAYEEDQMVLRSYAVGADLVHYREDGGYGTYFIGGGGIQRSRVYLEHRYVDPSGHEDKQPLAGWPAADTPFVSIGAGYQGRSKAYIEAKLQFWRYRGVEGHALYASPLNGRSQLRDAVSLTVSFGARF